MDQQSKTCHVVSIPYPGRGHVNAMMNLCKLLCSAKPDILITFVVTEEWYRFIIGDSVITKLRNIEFATIPNVIPSELVRGNDFPGFVRAVSTKMEGPFEELLDRIKLPVNAIVADAFMFWTVGVGNRKNIPVVSFWPMPTSVFSFFYHFELLQQHNHFPANIAERGEERVNYIPGVVSTRLADLPSVFEGIGRQTLHFPLEAASMVSKAQYLLFNSVYELEAKTIDALRPKFPFPVYHIGSAIPYLELQQHVSSKGHNDKDQNIPDYIKWLDSQPEGSVLYVSSMGSFLSVSSAQIAEIVAGLQNTGVRFLWVSRGETELFKDWCSDKGLVVPWCDQLKVLCHPSIGGFWTHCGWNSTIEAFFAGVPILASPITFDQIPIGKSIEEDWKIGWRVWRQAGRQALLTREEVAALVKRFMDAESLEVKDMRKRAREAERICEAAVAKGGSSKASIDVFVLDISQDKAK